MKNKTIILYLSTIGLLLPITSAEAIPSFARKYSTNCSTCHSAFPELSRTGRQFKEAGYRFPKLKGEKTISDFLHLDKYFPVSAIMKARPYDKKNSGDKRIRALHEVEIFVGGVLYKNISGFFEMEAEDEDLNARGFELGIPHAVITYNHSKALNVSASWASLMVNDPYDTYTGHKLTRSSYSVTSQAFGGADAGGKIGSERQMLSVHGRPFDSLFYTFGISGVADDPEGENPRTVLARLAWDITPNAMVGLLAIKGECEGRPDKAAVPDESFKEDSPCLVDRDFSRYGIDAQVDIGDFRVQGAYIRAKDDNSDATDTLKNDAWYVQARYTMRNNGRPTFVPLIRFDNYEKSDGRDKYKEVTLNLGYYFTQNVRGFIEFWDRYDTPSGVAGDDRLTLQIDAAF